jgi:ABC-2 type transport system permease protein
LNVWRIAWKELLTLRDMKMLVFVIAPPLLFTLILGTVAMNAFNGSAMVGDIRVLYKNSVSADDFSKHWDSFVEQSSDSGIQFVSLSGGLDGMAEVTSNRYDGYVEITESGMKYYESSQWSLESDIAQGVLTAFADRYKLAVVAGNSEPGLIDGIMAGGGQANYVRETSLDTARQPGALDYYAVAMTTLIILYGAMTAGGLIDAERKRHTAARMLAAPVTRGEIFAGKIAGNILQNFICIAFVVLISKYVFNAYWGENLGWVFLVLITQIIFALSLGIGFGYMFKGNASSTIIMVIIQVAAFFGGSYFQVEDLSGVLNTIAHFSPLRWTNDAILHMIYADSFMAAIRAIMLNLGFSVLLLSAAVFLMRRREGL